MIFSWWLAWTFQDRYITDWDGFDYTVCVVRGVPSPLGLGRALFIGFYHLLWNALRQTQLIQPENAHLVLRYGAILLSGPATAGIYALTRELTLNRRAALAAGVLFAISPVYIVYSGRPMSEIPGLFMLNWSLWWLVRSLRLGQTGRFLLAAGAVGLSANVREIAIFYLPFIVLAALEAGRRWVAGLFGLLAAVLVSISGMAFWALRRGYLYVDEVAAWYRLSSTERQFHPVTLKNFSMFGDYSYDCSVAVVFLVPISIGLLWRRRELRSLLWLGLTGLLADMTLLVNHDLSVNPRYLLVGMVGLAPLCGWGLAELFSCFRWQATIPAAGLICLTFVNYIQQGPGIYWQERHALATVEYLKRIESFPWNSAFVVGARTPLVNFYAGIRARPNWKTIAPGAGWPDDRVTEVIREMLMSGRVVYVDFDPEIWQHGARGHSREAAGLRQIREEFELEQISGTIFVIRADQELTGSRVTSGTNPKND